MARHSPFRLLWNRPFSVRLVPQSPGRFPTKSPDRRRANELLLEHVHAMFLFVCSTLQLRNLARAKNRKICRHVGPAGPFWPMRPPHNLCLEQTQLMLRRCSNYIWEIPRMQAITHNGMAFIAPTTTIRPIHIHHVGGLVRPFVRIRGEHVVVRCPLCQATGLPRTSVCEDFVRQSQGHAIALCVWLWGPRACGRQGPNCLHVAPMAPIAASKAYLAVRRS